MRTIYRIDLDDALPMLAAARAKAEEIGVKQTICVCDDGGHVLALHRLPGARLTGVEIAMAKAFTAAVTPRHDGWMIYPGRVGTDVTLDEARCAARIAAGRALSAAATAVGGLERITRLLRLTVYIASAAGFSAHSRVGDGASEVLVEVLGERGRVARTACGVAGLPDNACVEVELVAAYEVEAS